MSKSYADEALKHLDNSERGQYIGWPWQELAMTAIYALLEIALAIHLLRKS